MYRDRLYQKKKMNELSAFLPQTNIAYFTMELALRVEVHTYAGGLGVLAGDTVRSCADLELPVVFVTLLSRAGYFRQEIDAEGRQVEHPDPWDTERWAQPLAGDDRRPDRRARRVGASVGVRAQVGGRLRRARCCSSIPISSRTTRATAT